MASPSDRNDAGQAPYLGRPCRDRQSRQSSTREVCRTQTPSRSQDSGLFMIEIRTPAAPRTSSAQGDKQHPEVTRSAAWVAKIPPAADERRTRIRGLTASLR